jgi:hypothetical protein
VIIAVPIYKPPPPPLSNLNQNPSSTSTPPIKMMPVGATEVEMPFDRPAFHSRPYFDGPPAATAVFLLRERRTSCPESAKVYLNLTPNPEMDYFAHRHAYAYISPQSSPCGADQAPMVSMCVSSSSRRQLRPPELEDSTSSLLLNVAAMQSICHYICWSIIFLRTVVRSCYPATM